MERERVEETLNYFSVMSLTVLLRTERREGEKEERKETKKDYKEKKK